MSRTHTTQAPVNAKVYGQDESRSPWLAIICLIIGAALAVAWLA